MADPLQPNVDQRIAAGYLPAGTTPDSPAPYPGAADPTPPQPKVIGPAPPPPPLGQNSGLVEPPGITNQWAPLQAPPKTVAPATPIETDSRGVMPKDYYESLLRAEAIGALPPDKQAALNHLRDNNLVPDLDTFKPDNTYFDLAEDRWGLPRYSLRALGAQESPVFDQPGRKNSDTAHIVGYSPRALSGTGVTGLMQITKATGGNYGLAGSAFNNPFLQIDTAAHILHDNLASTHGDLAAAYAMYGDHGQPGYAPAVLNHFNYYTKNLKVSPPSKQATPPPAQGAAGVAGPPNAPAPGGPAPGSAPPGSSNPDVITAGEQDPNAPLPTNVGQAGFTPRDRPFLESFAKRGMTVNQIKKAVVSLGSNLAYNLQEPETQDITTPGGRVISTSLPGTHRLKDPGGSVIGPALSLTGEAAGLPARVIGAAGEAAGGRDVGDISQLLANAIPAAYQLGKGGAFVANKLYEYASPAAAAERATLAKAEKAANVLRASKTYRSVADTAVNAARDAADTYYTNTSQNMETYKQWVVNKIMGSANRADAYEQFTKLENMDPRVVRHLEATNGIANGSSFGGSQFTRDQMQQYVNMIAEHHRAVEMSDFVKKASNATDAKVAHYWIDRAHALGARVSPEAVDDLANAQKDIESIKATPIPSGKPSVGSYAVRGMASAAKYAGVYTVMKYLSHGARGALTTAAKSLGP